MSPSHQKPGLAEASSSPTAPGTVAPPPAYTESASDQPVRDGQPQPTGQPDDAVDVTAAFASLKLSNEPEDPDADTCLAHLKLLAAIQAMKEEVGYTDGLWGIWDTRADTGELDEPVPEGPDAKAGGKDAPSADAKKLATLSKLREKRWALFVARAVDRYESWWATLWSTGPLIEWDMETPSSLKHEKFVDRPQYQAPWNDKILPPLGTMGSAALLAS